MSDSPLHERLLVAVGTLTFRELGELTNTNHETVRRYMLGQSPSADFLGALCGKLKVNGQWLLTGRGPMRSAEIRTHALHEAKASELLSAMSATLERLQDRLERIELYVHTLEARLRGSAMSSLRAVIAGEKHVEPASPSAAAHALRSPDAAAVRAQNIADAVAKPSRQDPR